MSSRLFQTVREKNGLCYAIYTYTASFLDCGMFGTLQLGAETGLHVLDILLAQSLLLGFFGLRQAGGLALVCQLVDAGYLFFGHRSFPPFVV